MNNYTGTSDGARKSDAVAVFAEHLAKIDNPRDLDAAIRRAKMLAAQEAKPEERSDAEHGRTMSAFLGQTVGLDDFLANGVPEPTYLPSESLGANLFYEGHSFLFSGHKKAGKSWAMTSLAYDCLKKDKPVVYVDTENGSELFAERLRDLGCTPEQAAGLHYVEYPNKVELDALRGEFAAIAKALPGAFIVLDSLRSFMASHRDLSPNVDVDIERFLGPIMAAVKTAENRPTVGVIDHANRKGNKDDEFVAAGSFAKPAAVDCAYFFTKVEPFKRDQSGTVQITVKDDRRGRLDFDRFYRVGGQGSGTFKFERIDSADVGTSGRILDDVRQLLSDSDKPLTKTTIRKQVRGKGVDIDAALARLVAIPGEPVVEVEESKGRLRYEWNAEAEHGGLDV